MESAGSAVVDFGRFCTAFLVVMGIGMHKKPGLSPRKSALGASLEHELLTGMCDSSTDSIGSYRSHCDSGHGHVYYRWSADLRDDHKLHAVFSRRAGLLGRAGKV